MSYGEYYARDWAEGKTREEIKEEIARCDERYFKTYLWNEVGNAQITIDRINTLTEIMNLL